MDLLSAPGPQHRARLPTTLRSEALRRRASYRRSPLNPLPVHLRPCRATCDAAVKSGFSPPARSPARPVQHGRRDHVGFRRWGSRTRRSLAERPSRRRRPTGVGPPRNRINTTSALAANAGATPHATPPGASAWALPRNMPRQRRDESGLEPALEDLCSLASWVPRPAALTGNATVPGSRARSDAPVLHACRRNPRSGVVARP